MVPVVVDTAYYDLLEVSLDATDMDIKKAYKRKAMQHHPDKNPDDPLAHETFQRIGRAYETLSDPNERASYDAHGPNGGPRGGPDLDDLFASMFGGFDMGGGGASFSFDPFEPGPSRRKPSRGKDTIVQYEISLEDVYRGKRVGMMLERNRLCKACKGSGGKEGAKKVKCSTCKGEGTVFTNTHLGPGLVGKMKVPCHDCDGEKTRIRIQDRCKKCQGAKVTEQKKRVDFQIDPGTQNGERIALKEEADEAPDIPPGDVIFIISYLPHAIFKPYPSPNRSSDLKIASTIRLIEALLGFDKVLFCHLDGRGIRVESKKGERVIKTGEEFLIKGEGLPVRGKEGVRGDLWIRFEVEMPGLSWASRVEVEGGTLELPLALPGLHPKPETVEVRYLTPAPRI